MAQPWVVLVHLIHLILDYMALYCNIFPKITPQVLDSLLEAPILAAVSYSAPISKGYFSYFPPCCHYFLVVVVFSRSGYLLTPQNTPQNTEETLCCHLIDVDRPLSCADLYQRDRHRFLLIQWLVMQLLSSACSGQEVMI